METTPQSWSDIPVDLAGLVLNCMYAHTDRVHFAAVCPRWCSVVVDFLYLIYHDFAKIYGPAQM
jgi:hypothetical protein